MSVQQRTGDPNSDMRFRVPNQEAEQSFEDLEGQHSEDMEGDISEGSGDLNAEGGMTVAFKVLHRIPSQNFGQFQTLGYSVCEHLLS